MVTTIVTDATASPEERREVEALGVEVVIATPAASREHAAAAAGGT
jgi:cysteine synthase